jgi:ABC-type uncharacterized transport system permease subunit
MNATIAVVAAAITIATPLMWASLGAILSDRVGVLHLGIEGTMYAGAYVGFLGFALTGSPWAGLLAAVAAGLVAGVAHATMTVTIGAQQHVAGLGLTLLLIASCEFVNRLLQEGGGLERPGGKFERWFPGTGLFAQYGMTYVALLAVAPLLWWTLRSTGFGMRVRAVGESPEAADVAGISVAATRWQAVVLGSVLMALGGSFLTLSLLGTFTLDIISGRGWVAVALVIFARWRVWPAIGGALLFGLADAAQLRLAITPLFQDVPNELLICLPYLVVVIGLAVWGRGVRYPAAYLRPYRRT